MGSCRTRRGVGVGCRGRGYTRAQGGGHAGHYAGPIHAGAGCGLQARHRVEAHCRHTKNRNHLVYIVVKNIFGLKVYFKSIFSQCTETMF